MYFFFSFFRGESILLFLVQTVGRQSVEQRQYRTARPRSASASSRKTPSSDVGMSLIQNLLYVHMHMRTHAEICALLDRSCGCKACMEYCCFIGSKLQ
jgi:hypothetical protein